MSFQIALPASATTGLKSMATLPVDHALTLKTWFKPRTLEKALALIQNGRTHHFLFFRQAAALTCEDDVTAMVNMSSGTGTHPFVFRDGWCSQCIPGKTGQRCFHVAALAMLCLREGNTGLEAGPMTFTNSLWQKIGRYLCERLKPERTTPLWIETPDTMQLSVLQQDTGLSLQVRLSPATAAEIQALGMTGPAPSSAHLENTLVPVAEQLIQRTVTVNEQAFLDRGSTSKQLYRDQSYWMWLARFFFQHVSEEDVRLKRDKSGRFVLETPGREPLFQLILPRHQTWELLRQLEPDRYGFRTLPPAFQFSRVRFSDDNTALVIEKQCRLHNGTIFSLAALENQRYGGRYLVENSFFALAPVPTEESIHENAEKVLSLFSSQVQSDKKTTEFTVAAEAIPDFLGRNAQALRSGRHQVAEEVLDLTVVNEPESLQLTAVREERDWCYLAGYYELGSQRIDLTEILEKTDEQQRYIAGRKWLDLRDSPLAWFHELGRERITENGRIRLNRSELLLLGNQVANLKAEIPKNKRGQTLSFLMNPEKKDEPMPLVTGPCTHLRSYQVHGVNWLFRLQQHGLGGILADDMGLGKTHQTLALIELAAGKSDLILIVCPAAVLYHWPEKQQAFFPHISMSVYHGPQRDLQEALESRVLVTTYGILRRDIAELGLVQFKLVVFDEMHYLKNKKTSTFRAAARLLSDTTLGLTGTPVENNIQELETLLTFCLPDLFSSRPVQRIFKKAESSRDRQKVRRVASPFILRRTREQVLKELPALSEDIRLCKLSEDQVATYRQAVEQATTVVDELLDDKPLSDFTHILTMITRLKQICNHLCLLEQCTDWTRYRSGKWDELVRLLHQCMESNLKVVVFSQFTGMLDIIEAWLDTKKIGHVGLRGVVGAKERSRRIRQFNRGNKYRVCCASLLAGGTGIDLTGAQVVIHFDRWWNPAKEEQATARVHRMGQSHPVQVYKLVTVGTLEEKIHALIERKRTLAAELIGEDDGSVLKTLNRKELAGLFRYG